jgi:hypothetical protein
MTTPTYIAVYSATDLRDASGKVLDHAAHGPVMIVRRSARFVLMREDRLERLLATARTDPPQDLADLLRNYDAAKIRSLTQWFVNDAPAGNTKRTFGPRRLPRRTGASA